MDCGTSAKIRLEDTRWLGSDIKIGTQLVVGPPLVALRATAAHIVTCEHRSKPCRRCNGYPGTQRQFLGLASLSLRTWLTWKYCHAESRPYRHSTETLFTYVRTLGARAL
jgi:hypothetical protein